MSTDEVAEVTQRVVAEATRLLLVEERDAALRERDEAISVATRAAKHLEELVAEPFRREEGLRASLAASQRDLRAAIARAAKAATERDEARAERDEALLLAEGPSTLKELAAGFIEGAMWKDRADTAACQLAEARAALQAFHIAFVGYMTPDEINERLPPDQIEAAGKARALLK